jgi:hypothetical protein
MESQLMEPPLKEFQQLASLLIMQLQLLNITLPKTLLLKRTSDLNF